MRLKSMIALLLVLILLSSCAGRGGNQIETATAESNAAGTPYDMDTQSVTVSGSDTAVIHSPMSTPSPSSSPSSSQSPSPSPTQELLVSDFSSHDYLSDGTVTMDFNGDGTDDTLTLVISHNFEESTDASYNSPIRIDMSIADVTETFESLWNDGVYMFIGDFDVDDPYLDICYFESNTDVSGQIYIYRYDGQSFKRYSDFHIEGVSFTYDTYGTIYFNTFTTDIFDDAEDMEFVTVAYDYTNNKFELYNP